MLDIHYIIENESKIRDAIASKGFKCDIDQLLRLHDQRKTLKLAIDDLRTERNSLSKLIGQEKNEERRSTIVEEGKVLRESIFEKETLFKKIDEDFLDIMHYVPNPPLEIVPPGETDADNKELRQWGTLPKFDFEPKDHVELGNSLDLWDIPRGTKISGARFYVLKGLGAQLEQAVLRYTVDTLIKKGFTLMQVPIAVKDDAMTGTGFFPIGREDAYQLEKDGLNLIGTSEVPITAFHSDEILEESELPKKYIGMTTCFRREAGTYGKDTHGLYRVHQFQKVEQVILCKNDEKESKKLHLHILNNAEEIMKSLGLAHRVSLACTKEIGLGQVIKHEIETWMPSRNSYSETHSCSSYYSFQSRRLKIRYKSTGGKKNFVHTLNNTAIATPRVLIALVEQCQQKDGSIKIPDVLRPYMNNLENIK